MHLSSTLPTSAYFQGIKNRAPVFRLLLGFLGLGLGLAQAQTNPPAAKPSRQSLDGSWQIAADVLDTGRNARWFDPASFPSASAKPIRVPGNSYEALPDYNGVMWYSREFTPAFPAGSDERCYLRFGAVQYSCEVWLNGTAVGFHEGASAPFEIDVTRSLIPNATNRLILRIFSPVSFFRKGGYPIAFDMGGILQHVTLETHPVLRISSVFARPSLRESNIALEVELENNSDQETDVALNAVVRERKSGREVGRVAAKLHAVPGPSNHQVTSPVAAPRLWNLDDPFLYTVEVTAQARDRVDEYVIPRVGFREFRINAAGFFELNGKRIFVKSTHHNVYDPVIIQGTPRDMTYLAEDAKLLKAAGFNMMRFICFTPLPEQLDLADELGFLIYSEHQASWMLTDTAKFAVDLPAVLKRDRNHPSLVMWGLLNEESRPEIYKVAHDFLPALRKIDDTRLVLVSSGRWDKERKNGSASNPGSPTWNVFLGGEGSSDPESTGDLEGMGRLGRGGFVHGMGDVHIYQSYPQSPEFISDLIKYAQNTRPVFVSESGNGSAYDPFNEKLKLQQAHAYPAPAETKIPAQEYPGVGGLGGAAAWIEPKISALEAAWIRYGLKKTYPVMGDFFTDSARMAARQRASFFNALRSNPQINGFSLTSMMDAWAAGEGVMDTFREFKADHLRVLQEGWAKLRWCLLVNPTAAYAGQPVHLRVALANEDVLAAGKYAGRLRITGPAGDEVWSQSLTVQVAAGSDAPLAYPVFDADVAIGNLREGTYTLTATLDSPVKAAASVFSFNVFEPRRHASLHGLTITALNVPRPVLDLLVSHGAKVRDYVEGQSFENEAILVGDIADKKAAFWRNLYSRVARGAHAVFLSGQVFVDKEGGNRWLPASPQGTQILQKSDFLGELYHADYISQPHAITTGLPTGLMAPSLFGHLLAAPSRFVTAAPPAETVAVVIRSTYGNFADGFTLGVFTHHRGKLTVNSFNLIDHVGSPAADRLLINLANYAGQTATSVGPLPADYAGELETLGLTDAPSDTPKPNG